MIIGEEQHQILADAAYAIRQYAISHEDWTCWRLARELQDAEETLLREHRTPCR
jgi:hypothetical protein